MLALGGLVTATSTAARADAGDPATAGVLVRWSADSVPDERERLLAELGAAGVGAAGVGADAEVVSERLGERTWLVTVPTGSTDALVLALLASPLVDLVERDRPVTIELGLQPIPVTGPQPDPDPDPEAPRAAVPNDPLFPRQWGMRNTGQVLDARSGPVQAQPGVDARVLEAWELTRGDPDVVVGVIDTAIDRAHPDLAGAVIGEVVTAVEAAGARSHGTGVASIIAARADDGFGMAGVAPEVSVLSLVAFGPVTADGPVLATIGSVVAAFEAAIAAEVDVINASWTTRDGSPLLRAVIADAGIPVVAASGNEGLRLGGATSSYPVSFGLPNVVAVTALGPGGEIPAFANTGPGVLDIAAPGGAIVAATEGGGHALQQGTSASAPFVAGALALARSAAPDATTAELVDAVRWSSRAEVSVAWASDSRGMLDVDALVHGVRRPVCRRHELPVAAFADVDADNTHRLGIDCLVALELLQGRGDDRFDPGALVTRGQLATTLANLLTAAGVGVEVVPRSFPDVPAEHTHAEAIGRLAGLRLVSGDGDGRFRPDEPVSRAQLATLLMRTYAAIAGSQEAPSRSWFDDTAGSVHAVGIDRARDRGLVRGTGKLRYGPSAPIRRDQLASVLAQTVDSIGRHAEGE